MRTIHLAPVMVAFLLSAGLSAAQTPAASTPLAFEVASIKPAPRLDPIRMAQQMRGGIAPHIGMKVDGARVDVGVLSLADLIVKAYKVKRYQISGSHGMGLQRFDN